MSLFGSLKVSTTGLKAQGTKMGAISDNIANVNTVGYKRTDVQFSTLVTERMTTTKFNPGGVTARPRQTNDVQGTIMGSAVTTDFAISGRGWFVVTEDATFNAVESSDGLAYTRAGSFRTDEDGYMVNTAGFYLQGWPVNKNGEVTKDGTDSDYIISDPSSSDLEPVNMNRITNIAEQTENVRIRANLPAEYDPASGIYLGSAAIIANAETLAETIAAGFDETADATETTDAYGGAAGTTPADADSPAGKVYDAVLAAAQAGKTPSEIQEAVEEALSGSFTESDIATVTSGYVLPTTAEISTASQLALTTAETVAQNSNTKAAFDLEINTQTTGTNVTDPAFTNSITIYDAEGMAHSVSYNWYRVTQGGSNAETNTWAVRLAYDSGTGNTSGDEAGVDDSVSKTMTDLNEVDGIGGTMDFTSIVTAGTESTTTIVTGDDGTTYSLQQLIDAGFSSTGSGTIGEYLQAVYIASGGDIQGTYDPTTGVDNVSYTGGTWTTAPDASTAPTDNTYGNDTNGDGIVDSTEDGLYAISEAESAAEESTATMASVVTAAYAALPDHMKVGEFATEADMQAAIEEDYGTSATADDAVSWLEANVRSTEEPRFVVWDGTSSSDGSGVLQTDALFLKFNGDGSLEGVYTQPDYAASSRCVARNDSASDPFKMLSVAIGAVKLDQTSGAMGSSTASSDLVVTRTKGSPFEVQGAQSLVYDWDVGTPTAATTSSTGVVDADYAGTGLDGLTQFDSGEDEPTFETYFVSQDGLRAGTLSGVVIDDEGLLTAIYDNGAERSIYKIPLASFTNDNGLINESGNVYRESKDSGDMQLNAAQQGVNGSTVGSALEQSNVDLGDEFTDMIVTQQGFTANTRAITTTDEMLTDINNMVR